jgi:peptide/nickel transport system permease protein
MIKVLGARLAVLLPTAFLATVLVFGLQQITPGGAAEAAAGPNATPAQIAAIKRQMGLDKPILQQYTDWLSNMAHGDFGQSLLNHQEVGPELMQRLPVTGEEVFLGLLLGLLVGIPLGIVGAARREGMLDGAIRFISGLGIAVPVFVTAIALVYIFALQLGLFPPTGFTPLTQDVGANISQMALPTVILGLIVAPGIIRQTRTAMLEVLDSPYVRTAWALGLPRAQVYFKFALKNAMIPVVTLIGLLAAALLGGTIIIDQIFVTNGMGSMLIGAVQQKDFPVSNGVLVVFITIVLFVNLAVDLSYAALDPRIRRTS